MAPNYVFPLPGDDGYRVSDLGLKLMPESLRLCSPKKDNHFPGPSACAVVLAFPSDARFSAASTQESAKQMFRSMFESRDDIRKAVTKELDEAIELKRRASAAVRSVALKLTA